MSAFAYRAVRVGDGVILIFVRHSLPVFENGLGQIWRQLVERRLTVLLHLYD